MHARPGISHRERDEDGWTATCVDRQGPGAQAALRSFLTIENSTLCIVQGNSFPVADRRRRDEYHACLIVGGGSQTVLWIKADFYGRSFRRQGRILNNNGHEGVISR